MTTEETEATTGKTGPKLGKAIMKAIGAGIWGVACTFYNAWVLTLMWSWFAVTFLGAPPVTLAMAIAFLLLRTTLLTSNDITHMLASNKSLGEDIKFVQTWFGSAMVSTVVLLAGAFWRFIILPMFGLI